MVQSTIINTIKDVTIAGLGSGGGGIEPSSINVCVINQNTGHMPTQRPDGTALKEGDWVSVDAGAVVPFTITYTTQGSTETITVTSISDRYYYNVTSAKWYKTAGAITETKELVVTNPATESISGNANFQNIINNEIKTEFQELPTKTLTFTNKTINADNNTISNITPLHNVKSGYYNRHVTDLTRYYGWKNNNNNIFTTTLNTGTVIGYSITVTDCVIMHLEAITDKTFIIKLNDSGDKILEATDTTDPILEATDTTDPSIITIYNRAVLEDKLFSRNLDTKLPSTELATEIGNFTEEKVKEALKNISVSSDSIIDVQTLPVTDIDDKKIYRTKENTPIQMEKLWIYNTISNLFLSISRIVISQENYNLLTEQQKNDGTAYILPNGQSVVTFSYYNLSNKPTINSVTLQDNLISEDLNMYTRQEVDYLVSQTVSSTLKTYRISDLFSTDDTVISVREFTDSKYKCYILNNVLYVDLYFNSTNSISNSGFKRLMTFHGGNEYEAMYNDAQMNDEVTRGQASIYASGEYINTELSVKKRYENEYDVYVFYTQNMLNKTGGLNVHFKMFVKKK